MRYNFKLLRLATHFLTYPHARGTVRLRGVVVLGEQIRRHLVRQIVVVLLVRLHKLPELVLRFRLVEELLVPQLEGLPDGRDEVLGDAAATLEHVTRPPLLHVFGHVRHKVQRVLRREIPSRIS